MNYLVIDLEMCKVPKNYRGKNYKYASEIIQVGAVLLDEEYKEIGTLCQYVHPEFGILDYFITNLTGIEKGQIKNAPKLKDALIHMADWLGEREYKVFAWSKALMLCDIEPDGRMHDGLDDAWNTARLIEKLEKNPNYKLIYRERQEQEDSQPLKVRLGELFEGLNLQLG